MKFIDLHCDTAMHMLLDGKKLRSNDICIDINKMQDGECMAQFFAMFIEKDCVDDSYEYCKRMLVNFKRELEENKKFISLCRNYEDLKRAEQQNKIAAFLTIEEGDAIKGDIEKLREFKKEGISLMTLTWNFENDLGYPNYDWKYKDNGLTSKGIEVIEEMNNLSMIIDTSHLSDAGFYDCIKYSKDPIVASHSNARIKTMHSRNLTDDMIKKLSNNGGITGINFCSAFLLEKIPRSEKQMAMISDMLNHIKHIRSIGGIDVISLGSDFDGIENPVEIKNSGQMNKLAIALQKEGFKSEEIEKIFYKNAMRVIKDVLK